MPEQPPRYGDRKSDYPHVDPKADIHPDARIDRAAVVSGDSRVGPEVVLEKGAAVYNSILKGSTTVRGDSTIADSTISGRGTEIEDSTIDGCRIRGGTAIKANCRLTESDIGRGSTIGGGSRIENSRIGAGSVLGSSTQAENTEIGANVVTGEGCDFTKGGIRIGAGAAFGDHVDIKDAGTAVPPNTRWPRGASLTSADTARAEAEIAAFGGAAAARAEKGAVTNPVPEGMVRWGDRTTRDGVDRLPNVEAGVDLDPDTFIHPTAVVRSGAAAAGAEKADGRRDFDVRIGPDAVVGPGAVLKGRVYVGPGAVVGGGTEMHSDARGIGGPPIAVGAGASIGPGSHIRGAVTVGPNAEIGRANTLQGSREAPAEIGAGAKTGADASVISARVGKGAEMLPGSGAVRSSVGPNAVVGSDTQLVDTTAAPGEVLGGGQGIRGDLAPRTSMIPKYRVGPGVTGGSHTVTLEKGALSGIAKTLQYHAEQSQRPAVSAEASVDRGAVLGAGVRIEAGAQAARGAELKAGAVLEQGSKAAGDAVIEAGTVVAAGTEVDGRTRGPQGGVEASVHESVFIGPRARVHPTARIGPNVEILGDAIVGPYAEIGEWSVVDGADIGEKVVVGSGVEIGASLVNKGCRIENGVSVGDGCVVKNADIGANTVVEGGVEIGTAKADALGADARTTIGEGCLLSESSRVEAGSEVWGGCRIRRGAEVKTHCDLAAGTIVDEGAVVGERTVTRGAGGEKGRYAVHIGAGAQIGHDTALRVKATGKDEREAGEKPGGEHHITVVGKDAVVAPGTTVTGEGRIGAKARVEERQTGITGPVEAEKGPGRAGGGEVPQRENTPTPGGPSGEEKTQTRS